MTPELSDSGLPDAVTTVVSEMYASAAGKLKQVVFNPPGTAKGRAFNQARAAHLLRQVDQLLSELRGSTAEWVGDNLPQAFVDGIARAQRQARDAGIDVPGLPASGAFSLIDRGTMEQFARDIIGDLQGNAVNGTGIEGAGERAKRVLRQSAQMELTESDLNRILAEGVLLGQPAATIKQLRDMLTAVDAGTVRIIDKNGNPMEFEAGYYASMVVRTKTRQATVQSRHERLQGLGLDLVSIVGKLSQNFCTAYLGEVYSLSGNSDKYPAYSELPGGGPPFHPNCSKSTRPFVEELASEKELDMAEGDDDQDKMLGISGSEAQRRFKDLQLYQQVKQNYATTAKELFGASTSN